jgi:hypothetical protein
MASNLRCTCLKYELTTIPMQTSTVLSASLTLRPRPGGRFGPRRLRAKPGPTALWHEPRSHSRPSGSVRFLSTFPACFVPAAAPVKNKTSLFPEQRFRQDKKNSPQAAISTKRLENIEPAVRPDTLLHLFVAREQVAENSLTLGSRRLLWLTPVSISRPEIRFFICTIWRTSRCR